ncbi:MAG: aminotransferase class V-fold PLP-dependent enzyme, partial [Candidatus Diapherotrites archaeon]|nr:aminotransferase class V-fold PLP-dependent enzyme [Candidatus Diapherotrites archaeon]
ISEVWLDKFTTNDLPWKFEAGTPNIAGSIGLGAGIDYLQKSGMNKIAKHEQLITKYALQELGKISGLELYGPEAEKRGAVVSFNIKGIHPHDVSTILDSEGIAIRAGDHCGQPLMRKLGIIGTARASFYLYNYLEEVDKLVAGIKKVKKTFGK